MLITLINLLVFPRQTKNTLRMPPIFPTASRFNCPETQTLEHGSPLFVRIIILTTPTELILEIMIVFIIRCWILRVDTLCTSLGIISKRAGRRRRQSCCTTVTYKASLIEKLDQRMLTMTGDGAGVAHARGGGGAAGQTGEEALTQSS